MADEDVHMTETAGDERRWDEPSSQRSHEEASPSEGEALMMYE